MYVTKTEAQSYVDSAALAAATHLDGSAAWLAAARNAVAGDPKKWPFGDNAFDSVTDTFATSATGPWVGNPGTAAGYYYVRVSTTTIVPMYLIRVLAGSMAQVAAMAEAGRIETTSMAGGEFPFSPYTRTSSPNPDSATDPYGFQIGDQYTLRWGSPGTHTTCGADTNSILPTNGRIRGYCCVSQSAADLRGSIVGGAIPIR